MLDKDKELIEELENGYDPAEPARELERLATICEAAAIRIQLLADTNDAYEAVLKSQEEDPFRVLNRINVNEHIEKKNNLSYLSWAWAWQMLMGLYPDSYTSINRPENGYPYWTDGKTAWVDVSVTIVWDGKERTRSEIFPIMDYKNNSIPVEKLTSFNVNTALQRAWTKCIARHGLGFYVYQGEDLPNEEAEAKKAEAESPCTEEQLEKVLALYTEDEMTKMLKRMKKSAPAEITREEAEKMIRKRDMSLVTAKVDSF